MVTWTLRNGVDSARCALYEVGDRVDLHIQMTDEVVISQRCPDPQQARALSEAWRAAFLSRGWSEEPKVNARTRA